MSSPVGGNEVVSGTSASQPTVVARLDASASSGLAAIWPSTRSIWNAPIWSVNTPSPATAGSACTNTPSVLENPASASSVRAFLIAALSWLAQLIGSLSMFGAALQGEAQHGNGDGDDHQWQHGAAGKAAESTDGGLHPVRLRSGRWTANDVPVRR